MFSILAKIKDSFRKNLPIIRLYAILYLIGVFIGVGASILLRNQFSEQARLLFSPESCCAFWPAFLQQFLLFFFIFLLGLTAVGIPLLPLFPLYKGFSLGLLVALAIIFYNFKGFILGFLAFFFQNLIYTFSGFIICHSSARLSISIFELIRGRGKHSSTRSELTHHVYSVFPILPLLMLGALWEWKVVPLVLSLF